jgi:hypothetical protein
VFVRVCCVLCFSNVFAQIEKGIITNIAKSDQLPRTIINNHSTSRPATSRRATSRRKSPKKHENQKKQDNSKNKMKQMNIPENNTKNK